MQNLPAAGGGPSRRPEPLPDGSPGTPAPRTGRRRWVLAGAAAVGAAVAVALVPSADPAPGEPAPGTGRAVADPVDRGRVLTGPVRGSLAGDEAFVEALLDRPWGTDDDPPVADREVVLATATPAGRVALVVADGTARTRGVWLTGPADAPARELRPWVPDGLVGGRPATLLLTGPAGTVLVVVAGREDAVEVSPRLEVDASGGTARVWTAVADDDGVAVVPVPDVTAGLAAAVRVRRDFAVVHQGGFPLPGEEPPAAAPVALGALRPGAPPDAHAVGEALRGVARPLGVPPSSLRPRVLWAAGLTRTGGLGTVAVVTAPVPGGGVLVTTHGRVGLPGTGREVPCGTVPLPRGTDPAGLTAAAVCSVFDGIEVEADRSWLVVTAPAAAVRAEVLDDRGVVLDTVDLGLGGSVSRAPDGTTAVRTLDAGGRPLDVARVPPATDFGDYGDEG